MGCSTDGFRCIHTVRLLVSFQVFAPISNGHARYGIEGIAHSYEDPFGVAKIDINIDDIVEDARREVEVLLKCWQAQGNSGGIFRNHIGEEEAMVSEASSEHYSDDPGCRDGGTDNQNNVRFVISDLSQPSAGGGVGRASMLSVVSPGNVKSSTSSDNYLAAEEGNAGGFDRRRESALSPGNSPLRNFMGGEYDSTDDVRGRSHLQVGR